MNDSIRRFVLWVAVLVLGAMSWAAQRGLAPPAPLGVGAPLNVFSAGRALEQLRFLLKDESPHPVGSRAQREVRARLVERLEGLGLEPKVQKTVGCHARWPRCARVENVVAELEGRQRDAIVLMAHYDSVPPSPGAADDGAGVAALLETARLLRRLPPGRNRVLLVFTDAEEVGLLGAEAFFGQHPWVKDVRAVINLEGSGSGGPALLLRTTDDGGHLIDAFRSVAPAPAALSLAQEVFERMPNDTDFSVAERAHLPSIDFAFAFEFNHYHTPLDTIANLDPGTLQHHGLNVWPLVRRLRDVDLAEVAGNYPYLTVHQRVWLRWPTSWTVPLAVTGVLLVIGVVVRLRASLRGLTVAASVLLAILAVVVTGAACFGAMWLADRFVGTTVSFPADPWPWRMIIVGATGLGLSLVAAFGARRVSFWPLFIGAWGTIGGFAVAVAIVAPLAANLLIVPLVLAGALALLLAVTPQRHEAWLQAVLSVVSMAGLAYVMLTVAIANEQTQGLRLAPAIYAWLCLLAVAWLPLKPGRVAVAVCAGLVAVGYVRMSVSPLYSPQRPQHVTVAHVLDLTEQRARWAAYSPNPLPDRIRRAMGTLGRGDFLPWFRAPVQVADAPLIEAATPTLTSTRSGQRVAAQLIANPDADFLVLALPASAGIEELTVDGLPTKTRSRDGYMALYVFAPAQRPVDVAFRLSSSGPVTGWLAEGRYGLPEVGRPIAAARGLLAVPQHRGDRRFVVTRIEF